MQRGFGYSNEELAALLKERAAKECNRKAEELEVSFSYWQGNITACVTQKDGKTHLWEEGAMSPNDKLSHAAGQKGLNANVQ